MTEEFVKEIATLRAEDVLGQLLLGEFPFAIWRLPNRELFSCVVSKSSEVNLKKIDLEELGAGFAMAPYSYTKHKSSVFIPADIHFEFTQFEEELEPRVAEKLASIIDLNGKRSNTFSSSPIVFSEDLEEKNAFKEGVIKASEAIEAGYFEKVVLSRKKEFQRPDDFSSLAHFKIVCEKHTGVFCSMTFLPWENEVWMGASPESLVSQDQNGIFKTMALAGTQSSYDESNEEIATSDALWRQKEIEEQALVSRYIINCFKKIRVREFAELGPKSVRAGNLIHLQTAFEVDTKTIEFPQLGSIMLDLLHPTSAVCGMPKIPSQEFIDQTEYYDRKYYAGFLGPVNINECTDLFVNLRTMRASSTTLSLYAGCGITAGSNPEKEWNESEIKLKTIVAQYPKTH
ncbi:MAG: isochorismate synthase [Arcticibacterium sp.]|jgi:isochorismate synthase